MLDLIFSIASSHLKSNTTYTSRAIFTDLGPSTSGSSAIPPSRQIWGEESMYNHWGKGFYIDGAEILHRIQEEVRQEVECCDSLQGFQLSHSVDGGTGGGLGSLLLQKIEEEYPKQVLATFSVLPTYSITDGVVIRPYNTVLSFEYLAEHADVTVFFDHGAMEPRVYQDHQSSLDSLRATTRIAGETISGMTTPFRFPGTEIPDLDRFHQHLVPSRSLHFLTSVLAPFSTTVNEPDTISTRPSDVVQELCSSRTWTTLSCSRGVHEGRCLAYTANFCCNESTKEETEQIIKCLKEKESPYFAEWMPRDTRLHSYHLPAPRYATSATGTGNFTCIQIPLRAVGDMFDSPFRRKTLLRVYLEDGMDELEFVGARESLQDVVAAYSTVESTLPNAP